MKNFIKLSLVFSLVLPCFFILINNVNAISIVDRLKGKILLQVEENGEAWYVKPKDAFDLKFPPGDFNQ